MCLAEIVKSNTVGTIICNDQTDNQIVYVVERIVSLNYELIQMLSHQAINHLYAAEDYYNIYRRNYIFIGY